MRLTTEAIRGAFAKHEELYNQRREWKISHHAECWARARRAFEENSFSDFRGLYNELRGYWKVFRGLRTAPWSAEETFRRLADLDQTWRRVTLGRLDDSNIDGCWRIIKAVEDIKRNKYGPSVVAISKFLHFWNPGLFVIVDDAVVWRFVFRHSWIRTPMTRVRERLRPILFGSQPQREDKACDLLSYTAILAWCGDVIRANPVIMTCFADHVRAHAEGKADGLPLEEYEAVAMEWLFLGLVETPPEGVSV